MYTRFTRVPPKTTEAHVIVGAIRILIIWLIARSALDGWALSVLWGWFLVPTLGLPDLSFIQATGIAIIVEFLTYQHIDTQPRDADKKTKLIVKKMPNLTGNGVT